MIEIVNDMHDILKFSNDALVNSLITVSEISDSTVENLLENNDNILEDIFRTVSTSDHLKSYCKTHLGMVQPKEIILDHLLHNGKRVKHSFQYVSILENLKRFLEHDDVEADIAKDSIPSDGDILYSYKDGSAFKKNALFNSQNMALRIHVYIDDFEVCNPIGSRRSIHKLTAVYYLVGNIQTKYWSQTKNIHLAILARSKLVKIYGLGKILAPLLADLKILESDGINVKFYNSDRMLKGTIATISADNLASHEVGGFRQCFASGKICRYCLAHYSKIPDYLSEEHCVIRTADVHSSHLEAVNIDKSFSKTYGVKSRCVFESLAYFSVTESLPPDVMHDVLEGLCPINIQLVLQSLIQQKRLTVATFNEKLDLFVFSKCDTATKPPHLPDDFAVRGHLVGSASQYWCLFRNLPFLLFDYIADAYSTDNLPPFWQLHLLARDICKIVFAPVIRKEWLFDLQQLITEHHALLAVVDKRAFTPKLHFLVHYPRLLEVYGPLKHLWCMRFEACHQYYKKVAKISNNYKNIA